ncbi:MAG: ribbon-helix-helix protein, CopG family [Candidatus Bathyarchaeia archaeon]
MIPLKNPVRITVAFDEEASVLLEKMKKEMRLSRSELMRQALRFYHENKAIADISMRKKLYSYMDMLLCGEHVILDVDHWLLLLNLIETSPEKDKFWEDCKEVARSHAEQLAGKVRTVQDLLERLEACNFYRVNKDSESDFTLVLFSEIHKKFVKTFLEGVFAGMGFKAEVKEDLAKLRVKVTEL